MGRRRPRQRKSEAVKKADSHHPSVVSVRVRRLGQLFNSFDPSPFWDRDLDQHAAEFIEGEFLDRPRDRPWALNVTTLDAEGFVEHDVQEAVKRYYARSADSTRRRTRERYRIGQWSLALGIAVFAICMLAREIIGDLYSGPAPMALDEGLIVLAWIALWLPTEQFVCDIQPLIRERRLFERLAHLRVRVRVDEAGDTTRERSVGDTRDAVRVAVA